MHKNDLELGHSQNNRPLRLETKGLLFQEFPCNLTSAITFNIFLFKFYFTMIPNKTLKVLVLGFRVKTL